MWQQTYAFHVMATKCDLIFSFRWQCCATWNPYIIRQTIVTCRYHTKQLTHICSAYHSTAQPPQFTQNIYKWPTWKSYENHVDWLWASTCGKSHGMEWSQFEAYTFVCVCVWACYIAYELMRWSDFRWERKNFHDYYIINTSKNENQNKNTRNDSEWWRNKRGMAS